MTDCTDLTAAALADAIRARRISAVEAVEQHLARVQQRNPALNAVVTLDADAARQQARQADDALARGEPIGALHGVPITLKDCHSTAGMRTTVGFPRLRDHVPTVDGTVAARMKAAGAIVLGKTNVPPLLGGPYTDNPIFGRTNNPWNLAHTPGGSSGGAAAAVADRLVPLDIGSDALGSVRLPAHFCGLFGLKPSERRISLAGHLCFGDVPDAPRGWRMICTVGPIARSVADLELAFDVLAGPDGRDTELPPLPVQRVQTPDVSSLRVAWVRTLPTVPVADEVGDAVEALAAELSRRGARVQERCPQLDYERACATMWSLMQTIGTAAEPVDPEPTPARIVTYLRLLQERDAAIQQWDAFMQSCDVLLCPPCISTAFVHGVPRQPILVDGEPVEYRHSAHHCALFNVSGQPGIVMPYRIGTSGLPIGVQLVGRRWYDERLLAVARALEPVTGPCPRPPDR